MTELQAALLRTLALRQGELEWREWLRDARAQACWQLSRDGGLLPYAYRERPWAPRTYLTAQGTWTIGGVP